MNEREAPSQADVERARAWLRGAFSRFPAHVWLPQVESLAAQFAAVAAEARAALWPGIVNSEDGLSGRGP